MPAISTITLFMIPACIVIGHKLYLIYKEYLLSSQEYNIDNIYNRIVYNMRFVEDDSEDTFFTDKNKYSL